MSYCQEQYISALVKENKTLKEQLNEAKSNGSGSIQVKVEVDTTELDEAMNKLHELNGILQHIDGLTGRIKRDLTDINRYGNGGRLTSSGDNPRPPRD
ncbi:hypothetical protein QTL86_03355 [Cellulosilyticum sp. ST5]|uniref:hypothetical protein n=1 Tax=Cellulosilyticum sp. ST5 TaxID=3055805 RepID=UPI0039774D64